jgi:endoglycosylceramidase
VATSVAVMAVACTAVTPSFPAHGADPDPQPAAPAGDLSWIHVAHPTGRRAYLADQVGREVFLAGANVTGAYTNHQDQYDAPGAPPRPSDPALFDGACPANDNHWQDPPVCQVDAGKGEWTSSAPDSENDFSQMRALGFDVVRLVINWEEVEPTPGHYDQGFIDRVSQLVDWAQEQGIYTLVDFHEDNYGDVPRTSTPIPGLATTPGGQADGAPRWAVVTDGLPNLYPLGLPLGSPAIARAFQHFWENDDIGVPQGEAPGPGLEDHYIGALAAVMSRLKDRSSVVGVELMNEPQSGETDLADFAPDLLYPFYRRAIEALTGVRDGLATCPTAAPTGARCAYPDLVNDTRHLVFFEPGAARNTVDVSFQTNQPFSAYPNLVFAPHVYTHIFTLDQELGHENPATATFPPSYDFAYQTADSEARSMGTALFVTEFGGSEADSDVVLAGTMAAQERWQVGGTVWEWKANCGLTATCVPGGPDEQGRWSVYESGGPGLHPAQNGALQPMRSRQLERVAPRLVAGSTLDYAFDPATGRFTFDATSTVAVTAGDRTHETLINVPPDVSGAVAISGGAQLDQIVDQPDGSRAVWLAPSGAGAYRVTVG